MTDEPTTPSVESSGSDETTDIIFTTVTQTTAMSTTLVTEQVTLAEPLRCY